MPERKVCRLPFLWSSRPSRLVYLVFILLAPTSIRHTSAFVPSSSLRIQEHFLCSLPAKSRPKGKQNNKKKKFYRPQTPVARPLLTDYEENRNVWINERRLNDAIRCEHFPSCPGCTVNESSVGNVDVIRSAKMYFSSTAIRKMRADVQLQDKDLVVEDADDGFYQVVVPSDVTQWRTQAKLAVAAKSSKWDDDECMFGLYQKGTHQVMSIPNCQVHHPAINRAVEALVKASAKAKTVAFDGETHWNRNGQLRYVQLQVERATNRVCLTLVCHAEKLKETQPGLSRLTKELNRLEPDLWHSMWCHCNDSAGNNIFSRNPGRWHRLNGPEFLREPLPAGDYGWMYFTPMSFRQGNLCGFDVLACDVARAVPGGSKVCELYAGVGGLGLTALVFHEEKGEPLGWVRCSDENPSNPRCFKRSVDSLPRSTTGRETRRGKQEPEEELTFAQLSAMMESGTAPETQDTREKTSYMVASAAAALKAGQALGANVLIVDPPRKGLEDEVLDELCKPFNPKQPYTESSTFLTMEDERVNWTNDVTTLVYVSCGFDALARDCERLLSSKAGWVLESATGYVLFPGSDHVESLCVFKR